MNDRHHQTIGITDPGLGRPGRSCQKGNALLYVVVVMLILGVLGVTMVSLFTSASTSSATPNDTRRAMYMAESGMRYALRELRRFDFDQSVIDTFHTPLTYTVNNAGNFEIKVFRPWFNFASIVGGTLALDVPDGTIPAGYPDTIVPNLSVVNYDSVDPYYPDDASADILSIANHTATTLDINLGDGFGDASGNRICLAVNPTESQTVSAATSLDLNIELIAQNIFPLQNGAIRITNTVDDTPYEYYYEKRDDQPGSKQVVLTNLSSPDAAALPLSVTNSTYVILSVSNYMVIPEGQSGNVTYGGDLDFAVNIYSAPPFTPRPPPDIDADELTSNLSEVEHSNFIVVNTTEDTIDVGGSAPGAAFGAGWYEGNKAIGGRSDFCQAGKCLFGLGVRAFFIVEYSPQGEGFTFTLMNGDNNDATSVGGDLEISELMAYAGDSRLVADPTLPIHFLDGIGEGLEPPKMALEFDVKENSGIRDYCVTGQEGLNTRNDPTESLLVDVDLGETAVDRDVLQYVYWGGTDLTLACRPGGTQHTYDDNRHDALGTTEGIWDYPTDFPDTASFIPMGKVKSDPTVGPDGTIYFGTDDDRLFALNPDGSEKWITASTGGNVQSSPTVYDNGTPDDYTDDTIYVGSDSNNLYAFNSSGGQRWFFDTGGDVRTKPTIGPDGTVYVGSDGGDKIGKVFALNPSDRLAGSPILTPNEWEFTTGESVKSSPAVNDNNTPADSSDDTIYAGSDDHNVYAFYHNDRKGKADGLGFPTANEWQYPTGDKVKSSPAIDQTGGSYDGTIYVGSDDHKLYALRPDGSKRWEFDAGGDVESSPTIGPDGTIYVGSEKDKVFAIHPDGNQLWEFKTAGKMKTRPSISADGNTIYVASDKNRVYALNKTDRLNNEDFPTENEWEFTADGSVRSPALGANNIIYVGSEGDGGGVLYAMKGDFAIPKNERGTFISFNSIEMEPPDVGLDEDNWLNSGEWAVRMEVMRSKDVNTDLKYEYTLRTWIRQCGELPGCTDITGTFFQDTRLQYDYFPVEFTYMQQTIELTEEDHLNLDRILFGFTGATAVGDTQSVVLKNFQLSFIRPGDPIVTDDSDDWPPP